MRHSYAYDEKIVNAQALEREALGRLSDEYTKNHSGVEHTLIHYHKHGEPCEDRQHKYARISKEGSAELINFVGDPNRMDLNG